MLPGQRLLIHVSSDDFVKVFSGILEEVKDNQRLQIIAGQTVTIGRCKFIVFKTVIQNANAYHDALAGFVTKAQSSTIYHRGQGFSVQFEGTNNTLSFQWKQVCNLADDVVFFGPQMDGTRQYNRIFRWKTDQK